jgi:hypothetical protein
MTRVSQAGGKCPEVMRQVLAMASVAVRVVTPRILALDSIAHDELAAVLQGAVEGELTILWLPWARVPKAQRLSQALRMVLAYRTEHPPFSPRGSLGIPPQMQAVHAQLESPTTAFRPKKIGAICSA